MRDQSPPLGAVQYLFDSGGTTIGGGLLLSSGYGTKSVQQVFVHSSFFDLVSTMTGGLLLKHAMTVGLFL